MTSDKNPRDIIDKEKQHIIDKNKEEMKQHRQKLQKAEQEMKQKKENYAEYKIQKDMEKLEKKGFYNDPETYDKDTHIQELLKQYEVFYQDKNGNTKINPRKMAKILINEHNKHFFTIIDNKDMYAYNGIGYHEKNADAWIRNTTQLYLKAQTTENIKREVVGFVRDHNYIKRTDITLEQPINLINLANGILNLDTMELLPHNPDYLFLYQIPVHYDSNASYTDFEKFLKHICMKDKEPRPKVVKTIQEYIGYCFYRSCKYKSYMVFDGNGDNAKTTLLNMIVKLLGQKNNTSVSLQELNTRPFAKKQLFNKHINISDDLPNKALKYTGIIKQITGNSPIWADIKGHKDGVEFYNFAKSIYACNELPETNDYQDAFFSRQIQITLLNKYLPKDDKKIDNITCFERDEHLEEKLTTPEKLSGMLNYALIGLKRLLENKKFSDDTTTEEKRIQWLRKTNPIHAFIEDEIEIAGDDYGITVDDFFNELILFCERNEFDKPTARKTVTTKLLDENIGVKKVQKTICGTPRVWTWIGIKSATNEQINHYFGKKMDGTII